MFVLAINIPHKLNEFIGIKYKDDNRDTINPTIMSIILMVSLVIINLI